MNSPLQISRIVFVYLLLLVIVLLCNACSTSTSGDEKDNGSETKIHVGVYNGNGASAVCVLETLEALKIDPEIHGREISPVDIQLGVLDDIDVLIFPGGSGSKEFNSLGQGSASIVREFVGTEGKGLVGICAGGFLFATTDGYPSLEIIHAKTIRDHYNRGRGLVSFQMNDAGREIFPELAHFDSLFVQYYDGPIYEILDSTKINVTAQFISDIATHKNDPRGITPGKPAFLTSNFGNGKVFVSVGHPESTPGMRWMVPRMARWVIDKPLIAYNKNVVRPGINHKEVLYHPDVIKFEKENYWKLFSKENSEIIEAIQNLYSIRSRPSVRWSIGLLRHQSPDIRLAAANYLLETEYTHSIADLACALEFENDQDTKKQLEQILRKLKDITR